MKWKKRCCVVLLMLNNLAGGRKSMGFYIGYALSLFGRRQDRMSHILVEEAFETHPEFFYPPKKPHFLNTRPYGMADASKAQVMLAEIPFVRMRKWCEDWALGEDWTFSQAVSRTQEMLDDVDVEIAAANGVLRFGSVVVDGLSPRQFSIYLVMARLCLEGRKIDCGSQCEFAEMVWADYTGRRDRVSDDVSLRKWLEEDPVKPQYIFFWNRFLEERSKITKVLLWALGEHGRRFGIVSRNKCYFLDVPPRLLSVVDR